MFIKKANRRFIHYQQDLLYCVVLKISMSLDILALNMLTCPVICKSTIGKKSEKNDNTKEVVI